MRRTLAHEIPIPPLASYSAASVNPYAKPSETKTGRNRPKILHLAEDPKHGRTRSERQADKEGVTAERRAIKKAARRHLQREMLSELHED